MDRTKRWEQMMKDSIVDGVIGVLTEHGSEGLTMKRVAGRADMAKGTLYTYFDTKEELLEATIQTALSPIRQEIRAILDGPDDAVDQLGNIVDRYLKFFDENRDVFRVLLYERNKVMGEWTRYETSRYHAFVDQIAGLISRGVDQGAFRAVDAEPMAGMLVEANISVIHRRLFASICNPVEQDRDMILEIFLHGISASSE